MSTTRPIRTPSPARPPTPSSSRGAAPAGAGAGGPAAPQALAAPSADGAARGGSGVVDRLIGPALRVDSVGSGLIGAALMVAPERLASGLGITSVSIRLLGVLFVVNAWIVARPLLRPTRGRFAVTAVVDLVFAAAVAGAIGFLSPDAAGWAPWALAGVAVLSLDLGALKLLTSRRQR
jgi:hypothetical protein